MTQPEAQKRSQLKSILACFGYSSSSGGNGERQHASGAERRSSRPGLNDCEGSIVLPSETLGLPALGSVRAHLYLCLFTCGAIPAALSASKRDTEASVAHAGSAKHGSGQGSASAVFVVVSWQALVARDLRVPAASDKAAHVSTLQSKQPLWASRRAQRLANQGKDSTLARVSCLAAGSHPCSLQRPHPRSLWHPARVRGQ